MASTRITRSQTAPAKPRAVVKPKTKAKAHRALFVPAPPSTPVLQPQPAPSDLDLIEPWGPPRVKSFARRRIVPIHIHEEKEEEVKESKEDADRRGQKRSQEEAFSPSASPSYVPASPLSPEYTPTSPVFKPEDQEARLKKLKQCVDESCGASVTYIAADGHPATESFSCFRTTTVLDIKRQLARATRIDADDQHLHSLLGFCLSDHETMAGHVDSDGIATFEMAVKNRGQNDEVVVLFRLSALSAPTSFSAKSFPVDQSVREVKKWAARDHLVPDRLAMLMLRGQVLDNDDVTLRGLQFKSHEVITVIQKWEAPPPPPCKETPLDADLVAKADPKKGSIAVTVRTLTGQVVPIRVDPTDTAELLKYKIYNDQGIPPDQQRLVAHGKQLADDDVLQAVQVGDGTVLHLILRLRGS